MNRGPRFTARFFKIAALTIVGGLGLLLLMPVTAFYFLQANFISELEQSRRPDWVEYKSIPKMLATAVLVAEGEQSDYLDGSSRSTGFPNIGPNCSFACSVTRAVLTGQRMRAIEWHVRGLIGTLAVQIHYSHEKIFEEYVNRVYVGDGHYGLKDGATLYFKKSLEDLSMEEAAGLAGLLKGPVYFSPTKHPERYKERQAWVLSRLRG